MHVHKLSHAGWPPLIARIFPVFYSRTPNGSTNCCPALLQFSLPQNSALIRHTIKVELLSPSRSWSFSKFYSFYWNQHQTNMCLFIIEHRHHFKLHRVSRLFPVLFFFAHFTAGINSKSCHQPPFKNKHATCQVEPQRLKLCPEDAPGNLVTASRLADTEHWPWSLLKHKQAPSFTTSQCTDSFITCSKNYHAFECVYFNVYSSVEHLTNDNFFSHEPALLWCWKPPYDP